MCQPLSQATKTFFSMQHTEQFPMPFITNLSSLAVSLESYQITSLQWVNHMLSGKTRPFGLHCFSIVQQQNSEPSAGYTCTQLNYLLPTLKHLLQPTLQKLKPVFNNPSGGEPCITIKSVQQLHKDNQDRMTDWYRCWIYLSLPAWIHVRLLIVCLGP